MDKSTKGRNLGISIAIGIAVGAAIGAAVDDPAWWTTVGVPIGVATYGVLTLKC